MTTFKKEYNNNITYDDEIEEACPLPERRLATASVSLLAYTAYVTIT